MNIKIVLWIFLLTLTLSSAETVKITQKNSGKEIEVTLLHADDDQVTFRIAREEFTIKLSTLTEDSVQTIKANLKTPVFGGVKLRG